MIFEPDALDALERLAPGDERRQQEVAQRPVLEQEPTESVAVDRDVAQRLRDDGGEEDGLPGKEVQLAEEPRGAVADDLVAGRIEDGHLALDDRDERIASVADSEQHVADVRIPLLSELGERRQLRTRQHRAYGTRHETSLAIRVRATRTRAQA